MSPPSRRHLPHWLLLIAAALVFAPALTACGGGSALPDATPCPTPTPFPTSGRRGVDAPPYRIQVSIGVHQLEQLLSDFRARWPGNRFSSSDEFRQDFVNYQAHAVCLVQDIQALSPSGPQDTVSGLQLLLGDYASTLESGLEAVRQRNVTKYRDWNKQMDDLHTRLDNLRDLQRQP